MPVLRFYILLFIICGFVCPLGIAAAEQNRPSGNFDDTIERVDALVATEMKAQRLPGYALTVIKNGNVIIKKGYGLADLEKGRPVTAKTVFGLASLTKAFTAICLLSLVDQGRIKLDDTLDRYIPKLPKTYQKLTLRQLATMTAGVPSDITPEVEWDKQLDVLTTRPLASEPGSSYLYSNFSYRILGSVIEKVTGKRFIDAISETILLPNGMNNTGTTVSLAATGLVAQGYDERGKVNYRRPEISFSSGMLASNLEDMTKYVLTLLAGMILSPESYQTMWYQRVTLTNGLKSNWAFGWASRTEPFSGKTHVVEGMGTNVGVASTLMILPEKNSAVISLCNLQKPSVYRISQRVAAIVFGD
jgi:CubicO group peptidase (beta-lactamase class C family)